MKISPVILCGGSGTRLWPLSRHNYPKQFLQIIDNSSLFQQSINRILWLENNKIEIEEIIIVTNENHRFLVLEQLKMMELDKPVRILLEPQSKNTAPALTLASLAANEKDPNSILIVTPADQYVKHKNNFILTIHKALEAVNEKTIVILGIKPKSPNTGFGYIQYDGKQKIKNVLNFKEKPDFALAKKLIINGNHAWNGGIFIMKSKTWLDAIKKSNPRISKLVGNSWKKKEIDQCFIRPNQELFKKSPSDSIDFSVIENAGILDLNLKLVMLNAGWSDLGSFDALDCIEKKDINGNIFKGNIVSLNSKNTIAISNKKNVSLIGVDNLIVIETADSVLIANKIDVQSIKDLVKILEKKHESLVREHLKVNRPWGWFETIDSGKYFKVKRIQVNPGAKLSYQSHKYRNEHWVVIKGKATIICDGKELFLDHDESGYIKKGVKHQLINNEKNPLEIIEVQTGSKLSENDIKRYHDIYGRK